MIAITIPKVEYMNQNCRCPYCNPINKRNFEYVAPQKLTLKEKLHKQRMENMATGERVLNRIKNGEYLESHNRNDMLNKYHAYMIFSISACSLTIHTHCDFMTIQATSGKDNYLNDNSIASQMASFKGVTPVGKYIIKPFEFSDPNIVIDLKRNAIDGADWGDWRVRMHNKTDEGINYYGRDNFFLHCGEWDGSAGCIDIGGGILGDNTTDKVKRIITESDQYSLLEVVL